MPKILRILEKNWILSYLEDRGLLNQYQKAKIYILTGNLLQVRFKERNPKGCGVFYFRINKQFRAVCVFQDDGELVVYKIDNHQ